ncbi:MAG: lipoyl(octanoyl) transferase [Candidatus Marinimicrobia bacterium]|jgi:lipoyl(octanoyl) transferase|nr:lipoyl(octanoyl) transferase [Candidatus Neomarinimicrobiota bacterium]|tara:strand:- start:1936 stop:2547 length:612 start_codon:yes stop_codon:yes gene_type:complete
MLTKVQDLKRKNYQDTLKIQESLREQVLSNPSYEYLILVEHEHVYTLGKNANSSNILNKACDIIQTDRGGDVTYHGPGQLVAYPIINLKKRKIGVKSYVKMIEQLISNTLMYYGLETHVPIKETGVWVEDKKIASIGIHVSRGVTMHGLAVNINTDLSYFDNIISCGIEGVKMTTIDKELGKKIAMNDIKKQLISNFNKIFNT